MADQESVTIPLTGKNGEGKFAIIDKEDLPKVQPHPWTITTDGKVAAYIGKKRYKRRVLLHRFICDLTTNRPFIIHANGNKLDNRKRNLQLRNSVNNLKDDVGLEYA